MNRYSPPGSHVEDSRPNGPLELDYFKAWLAFALCSVLGGFVAGAALGGVSGAILGAAGSSKATITIVAGVCGACGSLALSYFLFRLFVRVFIVRKLTRAARPAATWPIAPSVN
jgi:hypothetical protein